MRPRRFPQAVVAKSGKGLLSCCWMVKRRQFVQITAHTDWTSNVLTNWLTYVGRTLGPGSFLQLKQQTDGLGTSLLEEPPSRWRAADCRANECLFSVLWRKFMHNSALSLLPLSNKRVRRTYFGMEECSFTRGMAVIHAQLPETHRGDDDDDDGRHRWWITIDGKEDVCESVASRRLLNVLQMRYWIDTQHLTERMAFVSTGNIIEVK